MSPHLRLGTRCGAGLLLLVGTLLLAEGAWLRAKAALAEVLIGRAFAAHLGDGRAHRPWDWADMHPLARLEVPRLGVERFVLSGASGSSLAFGVGHVDGTAPPNGAGNSVLAGHRDTRLAFLRDVRVGDLIVVESRAAVRRYRVRETRVVSRSDVSVLAPSTTSRLTLVTCFPFGGVLRTSQRYVVVCEPDRPRGPPRPRELTRAGWHPAAPPPTADPRCSRAGSSRSS